MAHEGHDHDHGHDDAVDEASVASFAAPAAQFGSCAQILHVDPIGGAAGDMLIAAFLDLGIPQDVIERAVAATGLTGYRLEIGRRDKHAIAARSFDVIVESDQPARDYATIKQLLDGAKLDARVKEIAQHVFLRLGEAEAKVHRQPLSRVHFHEVGGVDAIVDIVGASAAIAHLGNIAISIGALPMAGGTTRGAHGAIPLPAPATLELMIGLPVRDAAITGELVTPTGAALLRAFSELFPSRLGGFPSFVPRKIGYGAGRRDLADRPNVVRLVLGDASPNAKQMVVVEANLDDATGEVAAAAIEALLAGGARDAWAQPITMKKGRPAMTIGVLCDLDRADALTRTLLAETGSLGARRSDVARVERPRRFVEVSTQYGTVTVKIADGDGLPPVVHPELDVCRARAAEHHVPVREVIRVAIAAVRL
jgi:pyridinium-3,5-bisthiocarboxylic acid mononucleotide nickel chelatase